MEGLVNLIEEVLLQVIQGNENFQPTLIQIAKDNPSLSRTIQLAADRLAQCDAENRILKEKYQRLQSNIPGMLFSLGHNTEKGFFFTNANSKSKDLLGVEPAQLLAQWSNWYNLIIQEDRDSFNKSINDAMQTQNSWQVVLRHAVNGEIRWVAYIAWPSPQQDGVDLFDGMALDISGQMRIQKNIKKHENSSPIAWDVEQVENENIPWYKQMPGESQCLTNIGSWDMDLVNSQAFFSTDRKQYEHKLKFFKFCVDQAPDPIFWINQDSSFSYANERASQLLGYSRDELMTMGLIDLQPDLNIDRWNARWKVYAKSGFVDNLHDIRMNRHKDGHMIPIEISAKHVSIENSILHVAFLRDISQRQAVERQLKLTQHCLDQASIGCFWLDDRGRYIYANNKYCELLQYSQDELYHKNIYDIDSKVESSDWSGKWQKLYNEKMLHFENYAQRKDGKIIPTESTETFLEYEGKLFSANFVQDITERKQIEQKLLLTQFCFDKASIGILLIGPDSHIRMVNNQACIKLGYTQEELCNKSIFDISVTIDPKSWNNHRDRLRNTKMVIIESIHRAKDGKTFPVEVIINSIQLEDGEYGIAFVRDVSKLKQMEKERKRLETRISQVQKMEALGTLAGGIAHDFNNILSAIYGFAELAKMSCEQGSIAGKYIDQLCVASDRAKKLIEQILIFCRRDQAEKRPSDLGAIIKEAIIMIRASIPTTIEINYKAPSVLGTVYADQTKIHQVLMNLCTNAYHAMKDSGGKLNISLTPVDIDETETFFFEELPTGKYLMLIISDTGHGMDAETLSHIFEPYYTTKDPGEGTGMGLSTVLGIVKDHGGGIKVSSKLGEGNDFSSFFPACE